jgi:hypothetical protein
MNYQFVFDLETEIDNSFNSIIKDINIFKISKFCIHFFLLRNLKTMVIKIFGVNFGNIIARLFGSKTSQDYLNKSDNKK